MWEIWSQIDVMCLIKSKWNWTEGPRISGHLEKVKMDNNSLNKQFIDLKWLAVFGLTKENVLEYFYNSDFYDPHSNNEIIRSQGVSLTHLTSMVGFEYTLDQEYIKEPHLFVINKTFRKSPKDAELCEVYYCIDGIIYQSPCLLDLLRVRVSQISYNLHSAFTELNSHTQYNGSSDHVLCNSTPAIEVENNPQKGTERKLLSSKALPSFNSLLANIRSEKFS